MGSSNIRSIVVLAAAVCVPAGHAQERWDTLSARTAQGGGVHLYGVSAYSGYTTFAGPVLDQQLVPVGVNTRSDKLYGVQWSLGWQRQLAKTTASITYGGNYAGRLQYSNLNSLGHWLSLSVNRELRTKWSLSLSGMADYRTFAQYLFQPTSLSVISQLPANASELAAAFSVGTFSSPQAAAMFSGTPLASITSSPVRDLLLADRILSYGFQASANYAYSTRLNFSFSSISAGGQRTLEDHPTYTMPRTLGANAGVTFSTSYALSPRTNLGLGLAEMYTMNRDQGSYSTNGTASIGRMMGEHWFMTLSAGMNYTRMAQSASDQHPMRQVIGGGALGYRLYAHTFLASYNRFSAQMYNIPTGISANALGAWSWHRPGSNWVVHTSGGQHQIRNSGFASLTGWRVNAGFSRTLSRQFSMNVEYAYFFSRGSYLGFHSQRSVHSIRLSLRWHPEGFNLNPVRGVANVYQQ